MHRSLMVKVMCLAIFAGGCAVEPTENERPTYQPKRDRVEIPIPVETLEPAGDGWDLAELIRVAEMAVAERNLKAAVLPGIIRNPLGSAPTPCGVHACPSVPSIPRLSDPGTYAD